MTLVHKRATGVVNLGAWCANVQMDDQSGLGEGFGLKQGEVFELEARR